ncbi:glycerol-3-phosphate dehydrogenase/oxidase [Portibacter marinus]|uniref:glycerol-3-phosphate dehydrogenase/oxidase n=1 Tax=Portibacter marinus TaxID=2898660 RepID=UPI001F3B9BE7|nr:glycerol-3-phosphate dehydrogenase/oxidase [Portibacter marinus]
MHDIPFSGLRRQDIVETLNKEPFDLLIIGGGVTGCGIALDAASRGLKVALVEKNDFASGTSSKSTKLIHGGLRYLKQFDVALVRETGKERAVLNQLAPHLALPEKMLLPIVEDGTFGKYSASVGLWVYDWLAGVSGDDKRRMLTKEEALKKEPLLDESILKSAGYYAEYRTDDARLTIELIKKAVSLGAVALNYCEVVDFLEDEKIKGVEVVDRLKNQHYYIKAKKVVSAAGPWVDTLRKMNDSFEGKRLHLTKGVHLVFPHVKLPLKHSVYFDVPDGRMIFAIPRGRATYVGTTDTEYHGDLNRIVATKDDLAYLLDAVNSAFPDIGLSAEDVESNWSGLRPLIHEDGKSASEISRKDEIFHADNGLISIAGGKLTGYRKMSEKIVDLVCDLLKKEESKLFPPSKTESIPLTTQPFKSNKEVKKYIDTLAAAFEIENINPYYAWYIVTNYGQDCKEIIDEAKGENKTISEQELIAAEVNHCVKKELTVTVADFFVRRTGRLYFNIQSTIDYKDFVIDKMAKYFDWSPERIEKESEEMNQLIQDATTYYDQEFE